MKVRECMKRTCVVVTALAFVSYFSLGEIQVEASSDVSGNTVSEITEDDFVEMDDSKLIDTEKTDGKKGKNYIVKFHTKKALHSVKSKYSDSGEINENSEEKLEDNKIAPLELSGEQAENLESSENIEFIEEDRIVTASSKTKTKSPWYKKDKSKHAKKENRHKKNTSSVEWNVRMIKAENKKAGGENSIKVAILDSGIDWGNDVNLVYQTSLVPGEEEMTQIFMDGSGHGSSVASLIAAEDNGEGITGINPNVDIYSYRVLDDGNEAPLSRIVEAIYMAIDQKVNIINMSFGLNEYSEALEQAVHDAKEAGILVIAAAGNTGDEGVQYPASYEDVMAVGAVDKYGTVEDYSAKGEEVEIVAPGELVRTTGFIGSEEVVSGTSLAAPQITAVASLIWQKDPEMPADFVRGLLNESANLYGTADAYGNGLVDAEYALAHYEEYKKKYEEKSRTEQEDAEENAQLIEENQTKIVTFSDTGCVEGCWTGEDHESMVDSAKYCVRAGTRFPDLKGKEDFVYKGISYTYDMGSKTASKDTRKFAGMTKNPWWHGYYTTNYIKAAIYATRMANAIGSYGDRNQADNSFGYGDAGHMKEDIKDLYTNGTESGWKYALRFMQTRVDTGTKAGKQGNTNGFKRALVWGMAIHTATDAYAHSAEFCGDRIKHENIHSQSVPDADNKNYLIWRYRDALAVAKNMMNKYVNNEELTAWDLRMPGNYTIGYRLMNYDNYIRSVDSSITGYTYSYSSK